ncbi:immunity protein, partial [Shouchella clausii]
MAKEKVKKPFYKKWWVWVIAIIIIGAAVNGINDENVDSNQAESKPAVTESAKDTSEEKEDKEEKEEKEEESENEEAEAEDDVPAEYNSALNKAESYAKTMSM